MQKSDKVLHFMAGTPSGLGSVSSAEVPRYSLYGDENTDLEEMVNLEPLDKRCRERGWIVAPHTHPRFTQIVIVTQGNGDVTLEGDVLPFCAPCALIVPPFRIHGFRYAESSNGWILTIQAPYLDDLLLRAPELGGLFNESRYFALDENILANISTQIGSLEAELSGNALGRTIGAEIHMLGLFLALLRKLSPSHIETASLLGQRGSIDHLRKFIETHYRKQPDTSDMAKELGVTAAKLRNLCKSETGLSPMELLHDRLIFEAKRLLVYSTASISEIGYSLGFANPAYFNRFFARVAHKSPGEFRKSRQIGGKTGQNAKPGDP